MNNFDWTQLLNPEFYITLSIGGFQVGLYIVLFIIFAETGLFAGFFLPGDSLLFLSGIYSGDLIANVIVIDNDFINVTLLALLIAIWNYWKHSRVLVWCQKWVLFVQKRRFFLV